MYASVEHIPCKVLNATQYIQIQIILRPRHCRGMTRKVKLFVLPSAWVKAKELCTCEANPAGWAAGGKRMWAQNPNQEISAPVR